MKAIFWGQPNQTNIVRPGEPIVPPKRGTPTIPPIPPIPNETTFESAETSEQGHAVFVTLSDANGYASVTAEWEVRINGIAEPIAGVEGKDTNLFTIGFNVFDTIVFGDVVTVSHLIADSGIVQFIDQPVTNNALPTPAEAPVWIGPDIATGDLDQNLAISVNFGVRFTGTDIITDPMTYALVSTWPVGLTLDTATGIVSGAPTTVATYPECGIIATNSAGSAISNEATFTVVPVTTVGVKSVVFDITDNYGDAEYITIRSIEFLSGGVLIPLSESDYTAYSTTSSPDASAGPRLVFNTSLSKIDGAGNNSWTSVLGAMTNQRLTVVFNVEQNFDQIVLNNGHNFGTATIRGCRIVTVAMSTDAITDVTYGAPVTNPTEILIDVVFPEHSAVNEADDQTVWPQP